jgi:hypothetical protein
MEPDHALGRCKVQRFCQSLWMDDETAMKYVAWSRLTKVIMWELICPASCIRKLSCVMK